MIYNVDMFELCLVISKLVYLLINLTNKGAGYTWPGHMALKIYPRILRSKKIRFQKGLVLISGTNGKTTTAKLLVHILKESSFFVVSNSSGANLKNGIVSSILLSSTLKGLDQDYGVFEVDEFALPEILRELSPNVLILLNLSRDQLDRYGEIDTILAKWKKAIDTLPDKTSLVIDGNQKEIMDICGDSSKNVHSFDANESILGNTNLKGSFNARNISASVMTCSLLGLSEDIVLSSIRTFKPAYGRGEQIEYLGTTYNIFLAKNPASFNYNLEVVRALDDSLSTILFVLNDNIPDGRDVSWIYDIDSEQLANSFKNKNLYFAGTRGADMALRMKHAGLNVSELSVFPTLNLAFKFLALANLKDVLVLPNYSAMLDIRDFLLGRRIL